MSELVKKYLIERDDHGIYDLSDEPEPPHWGPEISFDLPEQLVSNIKKYIDKYDQIQNNLRELIRIGFEEKEDYEDEQIEEFINKFNKIIV